MNKKIITLLLVILIVLVGKSEAATLTQKIGDSHIKAFVSEGEQVTLQFANKPNYTFTNWEVEKGNIAIDRNSSSVTFMMPSTDVVIKANYAEENIIPEYTLTYDANEGTGAPAAQIGSSITISSTIPTRAGYTFLGWNTVRKAITATYVAGSKIDLEEDTILYAIWKIKDNGTAKLVYNQNTTSAVGNMPINPSEQALQGTKTNYEFVISDVKPTRSGYSCIGWSKSNTATTASYVGGSKINVGNETVTLYAIWKYDCYCSVCNNPVNSVGAFCNECEPCQECGDYCLIHEEDTHGNSNCESGKYYSCYCSPCDNYVDEEYTFCDECDECSSCGTYCLDHEADYCSGCDGCTHCCSCSSDDESEDDGTSSGGSSGGSSEEGTCWICGEIPDTIPLPPCATCGCCFSCGSPFYPWFGNYYCGYCKYPPMSVCSFCGRNGYCCDYGKCHFCHGGQTCDC